MKKLGIFTVILVLVVIVVGSLFNSYNSFVGLNEEVATQWAQVENQFQRRYYLIPNLVETVKGVSEQEQSVFLGVAEARSKVGQMTLTADALNDPKAFAAFQSAQDELTGALSRLLVAVEAYPDLKSSANFLALQDQLEGTENRIAVERGRFNDVVKTYNVKAKGIPGKWMVSLFGFDAEKQLFEATDGASSAPAVKFDLGTPEVEAAPAAVTPATGAVD